MNLDAGFFKWYTGNRLIPAPPYAVFTEDGVYTLSSISGLTYDEGSGPSTDSSTFSVKGAGMLPAADNITVTFSGTNFELYYPTDATHHSTTFTIPYTGGAINLSGFKVRMKAGLTPDSYSGTITISAPNTTPFVLSCSGAVGAATHIPIGLPTEDNWQIGDSISTNPYSFPALTDGYTALFDSAKSITSQNIAQSGQGIWAGLSAYAFAHKTSPDPYSLSLMMGFNDCTRTQTIANTKNAIIGGASAIFAKHYCSVQRTFADGTKVGSWLDYGPDPNARNNPPRISETIQGSANVGATNTLAFNGNDIAITTLIQNIYEVDFSGCRGFTIHIDGVLKYTFDPSILNIEGPNSGENNGSVNYQFSPYAIILNDLGLGAHTCLITVTAGTGGYLTWVDSLLELYPHASVASTKPCCWLEVPTLNTTGSTGTYTDAASISEINTDVWASSQFEWFKGYSNFGRVQTNNYYDPTDAAQVYTDNVHPAGAGGIDTGSYKIAQPLIQIFT